MPYPVAAVHGRGGRAPSVPGAGTIVQLGNVITGTNTLFLSQCGVGDRLAGGAINGLVVAITSNVLITLSSSATVAVGVAFAILTG